MELHLLASFQWDGQPPSALFRAHSGGIFRDMGVHEFDQVRWLSGQEFGDVSAVASPFGEAVDGWMDADSAHAIAPLSGGATALVSLGRYFPGGDMVRIEVFGTLDAVRCRSAWTPGTESASSWTRSCARLKDSHRTPEAVP